jgi:hypothetical protein
VVPERLLLPIATTISGLRRRVAAAKAESGSGRGRARESDSFLLRVSAALRQGSGSRAAGASESAHASASSRGSRSSASSRGSRKSAEIADRSALSNPLLAHAVEPAGGGGEMGHGQRRHSGNSLNSGGESALPTPTPGECELRPHEPFVMQKLESTAQTTAWVAYHGARPPMPQGMPAPLEKLLRDCWKHDPRERPSFDDIVQRFRVRPLPVLLLLLLLACLLLLFLLLLLLLLLLLRCCCCFYHLTSPRRSFTSLLFISQRKDIDIDRHQFPFPILSVGVPDRHH